MYILKQVAGNIHDGPTGQFQWLLPQHQAKLISSGVSERVALERGYESVEDEAQLTVLGFAPYQRRTPSLVIPIRDSRRIIAYQNRPDDPRVEIGRPRPIKYETPTGASLRLDAPVAIREAIKDTSVPLIVTEGVIKADSAVSFGYAALAITGVWAWKAPVVRSDLRCVDWRGRRAIVIFDSDVAENGHVQRAELGLVAFLRSLGANARPLRLPPRADGSKQGLDDFLVAGGHLPLQGGG